MTTPHEGHSVPVHGCCVQPQPPRRIRALALLPDVGAQHHRDPADAGGLRDRDPRAVPGRSSSGRRIMSASAERSWTVRLRRRAVGALPPEKLLPDGQPTYVASWIYVFGVLSLSALAVLIMSGTILAIKGPTWWHVSSVGHFFKDRKSVV